MTWQTTIYSSHFDSAIQINAYVMSYADLKFSKQFKVQKLGTINNIAQEIYRHATDPRICCDTGRSRISLTVLHSFDLIGVDNTILCTANCEMIIPCTVVWSTLTNQKQPNAQFPRITSQRLLHPHGKNVGEQIHNTFSHLKFPTWLGNEFCPLNYLLL